MPYFSKLKFFFFTFCLRHVRVKLPKLNFTNVDWPLIVTLPPLVVSLLTLSTSSFSRFLVFLLLDVSLISRSCSRCLSLGLLSLAHSQSPLSFILLCTSDVSFEQCSNAHWWHMQSFDDLRQMEKGKDGKWSARMEKS